MKGPFASVYPSRSELVLLSQPLLQFGVLSGCRGIAAEIISKRQSIVPVFAAKPTEV